MRTLIKHQVRVTTKPSVSHGGGWISQNNIPTVFTGDIEVRKDHSNAKDILYVYGYRVSTHTWVSSESVITRYTPCHPGVNPYVGK